MKVEGFDSNLSHSFNVKMAIRGVENLNLISKKSKNHRKAMTLPLLKIMGHEIAKKNWDKDTKVVVWSAMCTAFFGSFRLGELLSKKDFEFNSADTLLWGDVKFMADNSIQIKNKISKVRTPGGEKISIFAFPGHCCPVAALKKLKNLSENSNNSPVFKFSSGKLFTNKNFNVITADCLSPYFGSKAKHYSGYSFRAGLPSALAGCFSLSSEKAIKKWGRWNSNCFEKYTRLNHEAKRCSKMRIIRLQATTECIGRYHYRTTRAEGGGVLEPSVT